MNTSSSPHAESRMSKRLGKSKSITRRLFLKLFLFAFGLMLLACWAGYQTASKNLSQSLSALPKFKAISQASVMSATLEDIRSKLSQASKGNLRYSPEYFREVINFVFRDQERFIQEIGVKLPNNNGFLLFRDGGEFIELPYEVASAGTYSPFQQLLTFNLTLNKISLFPAVHYTPQSIGSASLPTGAAVMRMALPLEDDCILILGINLKAWSDQLIPTAIQGDGDESVDIERTEQIQLSYYFDNSGWILAERTSLPETEWGPNIARRGFGGDFGRPGYDAAFRPWVQHEGYWRMVTDIREGRTGSIRESASGYSQAFRRSFGFLCYAPILFSPSDSAPPVPIGGIAFFETAPNIFGASFNTIGSYAALLGLGLLIFAVIVVHAGRRVASPFIKTADELNTMLEQRDLHYLSRNFANTEHTALTRAINTLITLTKGQAEQLAIVTEVVQQTHAPLPIDIDRSISSAILAGEFGLVGSSEQISHVREDIHKAAQAGTDVLVWGETGTGKELVASAIHKASSRKNGPYISINCGALDENLLMDTLFGHVAGAFSDALDDRKGAFLAANGGTLHLDELGNASPKVQQSLLRALSVRHIRPLGSDKEIPFDTRVIAATNVDLRQCVNEGTFRQDLYYRLAIISIHIPPLRERKEDIPELAAFYIMESCRRLKKDIVYLSRGGLKALMDHSWPGNVREFANCLTRAVAFTEGDLILPEHLDFEQDPKHLSKDSRKSSSAKSRGTSSSVEYLWPAPARNNFTPAKGHTDTQKVPFLPYAQNIPIDIRHSSLSQERPHDPAGQNLVHGKRPAGHEQQPYTSAPASTETHRSATFGTTPHDHALPGDITPQEAGGRCLSSTLTPKILSFYKQLMHNGTINDRQLEALTLAHCRESFTRSEYESMSSTNVTSRTIQNDLKELVNLGLLIKSGNGPATRYEKAEIPELSNTSN